MPVRRVLAFSDDAPRLLEVGVAVGVDVADALEMGEDRHPRLALDEADEALAAARHDHVDVPVTAAASPTPRPGRASARAGSPSSGRPAPVSPSTRQSWSSRGGMERLRAAAQDHGVARLEAQRAGVGGDVRAALVDHADDAERRADAADVQAGRHVPFGDDVAHRVALRGHGAQPVGHGADAPVVEGQPVDHRRATGPSPSA